MSSSSTAHRCTCRCSGRLRIRRRRTSPFTGKNEIFGTLSKTATWRNGRLDINSFSSTSHDRDMGHLIEKEPSAARQTRVRDAQRDRWFYVVH